MEGKPTSRMPRLKPVLAVLLSLALFSTAWLPASIPAALVRIDLSSAAELVGLSAYGLEIYAHLAGPNGQDVLLAPLSQTEISRLQRLGYPLRVLDSDTRGAIYYLLVSLQPGALDNLPAEAGVLDRLGDQAILRAAPAQAEARLRPGLGLRRLNLHRLTSPSSQSINLPTSITPDPVVQGMINQVGSATVYAYDGGLSGEWPVSIGGSDYTIATRYTRTTEPIQKATQYAYEHLQALGLTTGYHNYDLPGSGTRRNVVAEQPGVEQPERIFLISAHIDSYSQTPNTLAPGADDNASGSVGVLIAADILSQYSFDCTLRYVLFSGEEQGLYGSAAYAADAAAAAEDIEGVLNLDMIAYNSDDAPVIELHTRPGNQQDLAIANLFNDVRTAYNIPLVPQIVQDGIQASDHASFWDYGYPAILGIEDLEDFTPYYHTTNDVLGSLNIFYFSSFVKAAVGTLAHMGCLRQQNGSLSGAVTDTSSSPPVANAQITATLSSGGSWTATSNVNGGYLFNLPVGSYAVSVSASGYLPYLTEDVLVGPNQTTFLDIPLTPCVAVSGLDFTANPANPTAGEPVLLTASMDPGATLPVGFSWQFGDGQSGMGISISHTYAISDTYSVTLIASNCAGQTSTSHTLAVSGAPQLDYSPAVISLTLEPGTVYTAELTISNPGTSLLGWNLTAEPAVTWLDLPQPGGTVSPLTSAPIPLEFFVPQQQGIFTTSLLLESNDLNLPQASLPVSLTSACTPAAGLEFSLSPAFPWPGAVVSFSSSISSGTQPVLYDWNFGDGEDGTGQTITHTFASTGGFEVSLTASNCAGQIQVVTHTVEVSQPPEIATAPGSFDLQLEPGETLTSSLLISNTGESLLEWSLTFDPPVSWLQVTPTSGALRSGQVDALRPHFTAPQVEDIYTTTLLITSTDPLFSLLDVPIKLQSRTCQPLGGLSLQHTPFTLPGQEITFTAATASGTAPISYTWTFGDQTAPQSGEGLSQVSHRFPVLSTAQEYTITVSLSNVCSGPLLIEKTVLILPYRVFLPMAVQHAP